MYLVTAATEFEMKPFLAQSFTKQYAHLVTGVGPVETAVRLGSWLYANKVELRGIVNFGVAGAYVCPPEEHGPGLLDICLAEREVFGDLGVCLRDRVETFDNGPLDVRSAFDMDSVLQDKARQILLAGNINFFTGTFVTVNCASGTAARGNMLTSQFGGLCENMEGAAVARVCEDFDLPCLEIRCVSNMVEDRDTTRWQLKKACKRSAEVAAFVLNYLAKE